MCLSAFTNNNPQGRGLPLVAAMMSRDPQRMQAWKSQFQAAHGNVPVAQLIQQRNAGGSQGTLGPSPSVTGG